MMNFPHFTHVHHTESLRFTDFGLRRTTEKLMTCLHVMVFYSTMNHPEEGRPL